MWHDHRRRRLLACAVLAIFSSGCATRVDVALPNSTGPEVLSKASTYHANYLMNRNKLENSEYWFDVPLIGLAAGAVATLAYFADPAKANVLAGLGIGAGLLTTSRTYLQPTETAVVYQNAASAMDCVIQASTRLLTAPVSVLPLQVDIAQINQDLDAARRAQTALGADTVPIATQSNLNQAITAATAARTAAQQEVDASKTALADVNRAINDIDGKVFTNTQRRPQSYSDLVQAIQGSATFSTTLAQARLSGSPEATRAGGGRGAPNPAEDDMRAATAALQRDAADVSLRIEASGYVVMQNAVKACAAQF